jgi:FKBP-type peptidyl-prolyl cis-trans isomerase
MKKLVLVGSLSLACACLLVQCRNAKKNVNNNQTTQLESTRMNRIQTASGLEYEVLQEGAGNSPKAGDMVTVHYTGWINENGIPGQKFDSSYNRNQPFSFNIGVGYVIKGWDLGVMGMKVGEKRRLYIPSDLGYGSRGAGPIIKPNSNLIFDVELIKID